MKIKCFGRMMGCMVFLMLAGNLLAENVNADGKDKDVTLATTATGYTLSASPPDSSWTFTKGFSLTGGNGWKRDSPVETSYSASYETLDNNGVTYWVDSATVFGTRISGTMYKSGGEGGSLVPWGLVAKGSMNVSTTIDPPEEYIPIGGTKKKFQYKVNGELAPGGWWQYSGTATGTTNSSNSGTHIGKEFEFPPTALPKDRYTLTASRNTAGERKAIATANIVEIKSITVTNAKKYDDKNWITPKKRATEVPETPEYVIITVELDPPVPTEKVSSVLTWAGGEAIEGNPLQRKVSRTTSAKTTVKATCGTSEKEVDIWVIWCDITIHVSGKQPAGSYPLAPTFGGGTLGRFENDTRVGAAMCLEAIVSPAGVLSVIKDGWTIKRHVMYIDWIDGNMTEGDRNDDSSDVTTKSTKKDALYDIDGPSSTVNSFKYFTESHNNFVQWIELNGDRYSSNALWTVEYKYIKTVNTMESTSYSRIYNRIYANLHINLPAAPRDY